MSIFKRIIRKFFHVEPHMKSYKLNFQGNPIKGLRIGSHNFIENKEHLKVSEYVYIGHFNYIEASNGISIGKGVQITSHVSITTHSSHDAIRLYGSSYYGKSDLKVYQKGSVEIGDFTFVGPNVTIAPGTKIGKGCVISAGSFVQGEFPDFSLIVGSPAIVKSSLNEKDARYLSEYPELEKSYMK